MNKIKMDKDETEFFENVIMNKTEMEFFENRIIEHHQDKLDFDFLDKDDKDIENAILIGLNSEFINSEKVDYTIDKDGKLPISFTKIKSVEDGIKWYNHHHSNYPDEVIEIICRRQFGDMPKKHSRKIKKEKKAEMNIIRKDIILEF